MNNIELTIPYPSIYACNDVSCFIYLLEINHSPCFHMYKIPFVADDLHKTVLRPNLMSQCTVWGQEGTASCGKAVHLCAKLKRDSWKFENLITLLFL